MLQTFNLPLLNEILAEYGGWRSLQREAAALGRVGGVIGQQGVNKLQGRVGYYGQSAYCYHQVLQIDQHLPWTDEAILPVLARISPAYLTLRG